MRTTRFLPLLLGTLLLGPVSATADTVVLTNGDVLSGTVGRLEDGKIALRTKLFGTLRIPWNAIESIRTDTEYSLQTEDGEVLEGLLQREGERTMLERPSGPPVVRDSDSVRRAVPGAFPKGFQQLLHAMAGSADVGFSVARGSQSQMRSSLGAKAEYRSAAYVFRSSLSSLFARQNGARSQSRHALDMRVDRQVNDRTFTYGRSNFERNERRNLDLRTQLGGGIGQRIVVRDNFRLSLLGGAGYVHEDLREVGNRSTMELKTGTELSADLFSVVRFETQFTMYPDILDRRRLRLEVDSELRIPLSRQFTYSVRLFDRFDGRPLARMVGRNDYGIVTGLGLKF